MKREKEEDRPSRRRWDDSQRRDDRGRDDTESRNAVKDERRSRSPRRGLSPRRDERRRFEGRNADRNDNRGRKREGEWGKNRAEGVWGGKRNREDEGEQAEEEEEEDEEAKQKRKEKEKEEKRKKFLEDLEPSGKLVEETNTVKGVVVKYNEPPDARKPDRKWRLYVFKDGELKGKLCFSCIVCTFLFRLLFC